MGRRTLRRVWGLGFRVSEFWILGVLDLGFRVLGVTGIFLQGCTRGLNIVNEVCQIHAGFLELGGPFGGTCGKDHRILGSILETPTCGNYLYVSHHYLQADEVMAMDPHP